MSTVKLNEESGGKLVDRRRRVLDDIALLISPLLFQIYVTNIHIKYSEAWATS